MQPELTSLDLDLELIVKTYNYKQAEEILRKKSQLSTILEAATISDLTSKADHDKILQFLSLRGWETEISKFPVTTYRLDAFKDGTGAEVERSLIDAVHRTFFRCIWSHSKNLLDTLVLIVPTYKEPKFENVKRDIEAFKEVIPYPIYLLGIA